MIVTKDIFLKRRMVKAGIAAAAALAVTGGIYFALHNQDQAVLAKINQINAEKQNKNSELAKAIADYEELQKAYAIYTSIPAHKLPTVDGYTTASARLREAQPVIDTLRNNYLFKNLDISFSTIGTVTNPEVTYHDIVENVIDLSFEVGTDEMLFSFLNDLIAQLPGYVQVESLDINRTPSTVDGVLASPEARQALVPLVSGKSSLRWITLRAKPVDAATTSATPVTATP